VLVTAPEFLRAEATFRSMEKLRCVEAPSAEADLAAAIAATGARYVIAGSTKYRKELYAALPPGGVIARMGVGWDNIDLPQATAAGLVCTNTPNTLETSVAEHTMALVLAAARHLISLDHGLRDGEWAPRMGTELRGKTLAIVGCGHIGRAVARIASAGFGMRVVGCRRAGTAAGSGPMPGFDLVTDDVGVAVRDADFVTLHIPGTPENAQFINPARLAAFAEQAWLINTSRGAVVDEVALYDALTAGRIAGAALDVFAREPYVPVSPDKDLRTLSCVILTPHVSSNTADANRRMAERALGNILFAEAREIDRMDILNREVLGR
jgi:phosphoglycerate dehydrogenase-like enzyme